MIEAALRCIVFLGVLAGSATEPSSTPAVPTIEDLDVRIEGNALRVSFRLEGAFNADVVDRIHSGLEVTFSHRVDLLARRLIPVIPSRVLGRTLVETSARYDSLTRQYYLTRRTTYPSSGRGRDPAIDGTSAVTASLQDMQAWMSSFRDVPLPAPEPEIERKIRVRVRSVLGRRYRLLVFPTHDAVLAERVLER